MVEVYRYSNSSFTSQKQTAWLKFLTHLKKINSLNKEPSYFYFIYLSLYYKIFFKNSMLSNALFAFSNSKKQDSSISFYGNPLARGQSIVENIEPLIQSRAKGVWVFIGPPTTKSLNSNCFPNHCEQPLYKGKVLEETMAYEIFGNSLSYKPISVHKDNNVQAVFIPNPEVTEIALVDKKSEFLDFSYLEHYGFIKSSY